MTESRSGTGNAQDEPGTPCHSRSKEVIKEYQLGEGPVKSLSNQPT